MSTTEVIDALVALHQSKLHKGEEFVLKLVHTACGKLESMNRLSLPDDWVQEYRVGEWAVPLHEGTKLAAHRPDSPNPYKAEAWESLYLAAATGVVPCNTAVLKWDDEEALLAYWRGDYVVKMRFSSYEKLVWCDSIMLLAEVPLS